MDKCKLSVVIPTYNRENKIPNAINSVINSFTDECLFEIIVVDDRSTDNTVALLNQKYQKEIENGILKIIVNDINLGVSGARNRGFELSSGKWIFFLDSDDALLVSNKKKILNSLEVNENAPLIFFRCIDENNNFVGEQFSNEKRVEIKEYISNGSYGEVLCVVNKSIVNDKPFDEYLRGYEGLSIARIIHKYQYAILSNIIGRLYNCDGDDRLSINKGFLNRLTLLSKGHFLMIKEFGKYMIFKQKAFYFFKAITYFLVGNFYKLVRLKK